MSIEGTAEPGVPPAPEEVPTSAAATLGITPTPIAVVIDANLWHKHLNLDRLTAHAARLLKSGIEVWVPEQVALEWAEHAHEEIQQIAERWKKPEVAGIYGPLPGPGSIGSAARTGDSLTCPTAWFPRRMLSRQAETVSVSEASSYSMGVL
jgi:hypothetical protein